MALIWFGHWLIYGAYLAVSIIIGGVDNASW
jgi:hypothetical protein